MMISRMILTALLLSAPGVHAGLYPGIFHLRAALNLDNRADVETVKWMYHIHVAELLERDRRQTPPVRTMETVYELWNLELLYEETFNEPAPPPNPRLSRLKKNPGFTIFSPDNPFPARPSDCQDDLT